MISKCYPHATKPYLGDGYKAAILTSPREDQKCLPLMTIEVGYEERLTSGFARELGCDFPALLYYVTESLTILCSRDAVHRSSQRNDKL